MSLETPIHVALVVLESLLGHIGPQEMINLIILSGVTVSGILLVRERKGAVERKDAEKLPLKRIALVLTAMIASAWYLCVFVYAMKAAVIPHA